MIVSDQLFELCSFAGRSTECFGSASLQPGRGLVAVGTTTQRGAEEVEVDEEAADLATAPRACRGSPSAMVSET